MGDELMRINSKAIAVAGLFAVLLACENGSPNGPTPPPTCTYTLSTAGLAFQAQGGSASVGVATTAQCAWTAASDRAWLTITAGANSTGPGNVRVSVSVNPGVTGRTGTLTIAGQEVPAQQDAQPACTVSIAPVSASHGADAAAGTVTVIAPSYCPWSAVSSASWLRVTSGSTGQGNGTVAYAAEANRDTASRTATIVINEQTFTVNQAGEAIVCDYLVAPVQFAPCMSAPYTMTATVTAPATCSWSASAGASWITVVDGSSGSGPGVVSFRVTDNWDAPRTGVVEVRWPTDTAGQNIQVGQAGCHYGVSTTLITVPADGGQAQFEVLQQSDPATCGGPTQDGCIWSAEAHAPWITITTPMPQKGDHPVRFTVAPNSTGTARSTSITVRGKSVIVTQAGS
jgi:hypothetical protein